MSLIRRGHGMSRKLSNLRSSHSPMFWRALTVRLLDMLRRAGRDQQDREELRILQSKLSRGAEKRGKIIASCPLPDLGEALLDFEKIFGVLQPPPQPNAADMIEIQQVAKHILA